MTTFYSENELKLLGIKRCGENVLISRNAIIYKPGDLEIGSNVRIDDFTTISGKIVLGNYVHIAQSCSLFGGKTGIVMEDFSGLSSHVTIYATSNDYSGNFLTNPTVPAQYTCGIEAAVNLGKHVIVGSMSVILPGVTIPIGCSIGAGSLCNKSLVEWGIYAGTPVRRIKDRSKHLLQLEEELIAETNKICNLRVGDSMERRYNTEYENAGKYTALTGDDNPIHFETEQAYQSRYGKPIVHGMILAGYISGVVGALMPDKGCIYESQSLTFVRPVFYGDVILVKVTVTAIDVVSNRVKLKTECFNQAHKLVLGGEAVVLPGQKAAPEC